MKELVFNIAEVFDSSNSAGVLRQYNCQSYYIPSYQRGYKWSSDESGGVSILLNDLINSFEKERKEYYLQYITVKKVTIESDQQLEVIDGQQRLTTLSIIISVISEILNQSNISDNKLVYASRSNFFESHIYNKSSLAFLINTSWEELIKKFPELNTQDIYYIVQASKKCSKFFKTGKLKKNDQLVQFYNYLIFNVKLIINSVEKHIKSEQVFKNLNSNKVNLTETELIKGLLITRIGRQTSNQTLSFKDISEVRLKIAIKWNEINHWAWQPDIKSFYFHKESDPMLALLRLVGLNLKEGISESKLKNEKLGLFNFFTNYNDLQAIYNQLYFTKETLSSWHYNSEIYHLLGFIITIKEGSKEINSFLKLMFKFKEKTILLKYLTKQKDKLLAVDDIEKINYNEHASEIFNLLLGINVFSKENSYRFNFRVFKKEKWSLEHIIPQNPKKEIQIEEEDIRIFRELINEDKLIQIDLNIKEENENIAEMYFEALKNEPIIQSIGNLCLLASPDNSSNGNKLFKEKRINILSRVQKGSFIPKHTFDVFGKMFSNAETNKMTLWTKKDINSNLEQIKSLLP
jgi:uncharacterized protein with ParB-like and HNH nuclease domain